MRQVPICSSGEPARGHSVRNSFDIPANEEVPRRDVLRCAHGPCGHLLSKRRIEAGANYCSPQCRRRARNRRTPASRRYNAARPTRAFWSFARAVESGHILEVAEDADSQSQARALIDAGMCAYENARGTIRDIGAPRRAADGGRVFKQQAAGTTAIG
ncbi:MAG: hypothetical protein NVSMB25_05520 [Thermoleophilaceae bacterium]